MESEEAGSGKEDEPEVEAGSEQEDDDGSGPSTSAGSSQSNNRTMRNMAEKMRRDKLNFFINELSTLVPIISFSPKKLDKTSILRLAATYIRLHNVIFGSVRTGRDRRASPSAAVHGQMMEYLPQYLASFNWSENVLEEMDGMLMIVNGAGRIIFISHSVEKLLGHTQIELMGQSLFKLTCLEDFDELKRNLSPDEDLGVSAANSDAGVDESSSDSVSSARGSTPTPASAVAQDAPDRKLRRSFYIRLQQRAQSRSDQPQYELVHVMGHLRTPPRTHRRSDNPPNSNDVILVAVVKPFREKRITTLSLMEACREEFITRHTLDGRIIYTDHRISIVAGYLSEEVCGVPGFQYMHKEDMRWTMVGLRQMFFRGSSYGKSCYRLQTKNGNFIYIKTCGYLELSENNENFQSLICINSLVSATEGEELIKQMKEQYSPIIKNKTDKTFENIITTKSPVSRTETQGEIEDPKVVEAACNHLISSVPSSPAPFPHSPSPANTIDPSDAQFAKATLAAKAMPPLHVYTRRIGIVAPIIKTPTAVAASLSPPSSLHSPPMPASCSSLSPPTPPAPPPPALTLQNRPSVLRVAHRQGDQVSVLKVKKLRMDDGCMDVQSEPSPGPAEVPPPPRSVLVAPGSKRKSEEWTVTAPAPSADIAPAPQPQLPPPPPLSPPQFPLDVNEILTDTDFLDIHDASSPLLSNNLDDVDIYGMGMALSWAQPDTLETTHQTLDSRIQLQGSQIHDIEQDLSLVPPDHSDSSLYNSRLSQLQMEDLAKLLQHVYHKMNSFRQKLEEPI